MAEMAVAIMVVSLPSMRSYLRRGGFFSSRQTYGHSSSDQHLRTPNRKSTYNHTTRSARSRRDGDDSGSEVELNDINKNIIVETHEINVDISPVTADDRLEFGK